MKHQLAHRGRFRPWWAPPVAAGVSLLAVAAWGTEAHQPRLPEAGPPPALAPVTPGPVRVTPGPVRVTPAATGLAAARDEAPPVTPPPAMPAVLPVGAESVQIPGLHVKAAAVPESVQDGALGVPSDPAEVGWWMPSTAELVIDGHVDMAGVGPGALYNVRTLRPGSSVVVQTAGGWEHWTVDGVRSYQKGDVPAGLFHGRVTQARLVIITCGGAFDHATHHYADNVVAYASPSRA